MTPGSMNVIGIDCEHERDEPMAQDALRTVVNQFPGHDWMIAIRGGIMAIKALDIHPDWCFALHYSQIKSDAADRKKEVMRGAGEFLERAHIIQGKVRFQDVNQKVRDTL